MRSAAAAAARASRGWGAVSPRVRRGATLGSFPSRAPSRSKAPPDPSRPAPALRRLPRASPRLSGLSWTPPGLALPLPLSNYDKGALAVVLEDIMGKGLIPADPVTWKNRRRAIAPAFHRLYLERMVRSLPFLCFLVCFPVCLNSAQVAALRSSVCCGTPTPLLRPYLRPCAIKRRAHARLRLRATASPC